MNAKYYTKTINPALGEYRMHNPNWKPTAFNGKIRNDKNSKKNVYTILKLRASYCHEYIGPGIGGYDNLFLPISDLRNIKKIKNSKLNKFFE
jgi:hypothetical protein